MEEAAGSGVRAEQRQADGGQKVTPSSGGSTAPRRRSRKDYTPEEWSAAMAFFNAVVDDYFVYAAMTEDDVEEEYRRAGKLDKYDPETELYKRCARIAKKHPPPAGFIPEIEEYLKLIEDED